MRARLSQVVENTLDYERLQQLIEDRALTHEILDATRIKQIREDMERAQARRCNPISSRRSSAKQ